MQILAKVIFFNFILTSLIINQQTITQQQNKKSELNVSAHHPAINACFMLEREKKYYRLNCFN